MSYMNQPYAPMPPQGPPPRRMSAGKIVALTVGGLFALIIVFSAIGAALSGGGSDDGSGKQDPPAAAQPKDAAADKAEDGKSQDESKDVKKDEPEPAAEAKPETKEYGDGDYVVGEDIPPGTYETAGADSDIFDLCTITTEPKGDKFPQMKTGNKNERLIITLSESDGTLTVQGCHPLKKR